MKKTLVAIVAVGTVIAGCTPEEFHAADLPRLKPERVKKLEAGKIPWIVDGKALLPIVRKGKLKDDNWVYWSRFTINSAGWLRSAVKEMTGVEPPLVRVADGEPLPEGPALFIGDEFAKAAGIEVPDRSKHEFRVVSKNGSIYFCGREDYAVYDFGERVLGIRQYWATADGGRSVLKTRAIILPELDYSDAPVYAKRDFWPYEYKHDWFYVWKGGNCHRPVFHCHVPHAWHTDTNFNYKVTRPEIFELTRDGRRAASPMLCYSNPKTFETYIERMEMELAGGPKSGLMDGPTKTITIQQWDANIDCQCEDCKRNYDEKLGTSGNASRLFYAFVRKVSDYVAEHHPEMTVMIAPYMNTCDVPEGLTFPAKNVEALVCAMPGFAMLKEPSVWEHEIDLALAWEKACGRPVTVCQYSCWPADFCSAPFVFGHLANDYFRRMHGHIVGSFGNGPYPENRLVLSAYVWVRSMWNFDFDVEKAYDVFAERMFGAGAPAMRKVIAMQARGWMRKWPVAQVAAKSIHKISYPRAEVEEMERLFAEAKAACAGDELSLKRLAWYEKGFTEFFKESADFASGTALEPTLIQKVASDAMESQHYIPVELCAERYPKDFYRLWRMQQHHTSGLMFSISEEEMISDMLASGEDGSIVGHMMGLEAASMRDGYRSALRVLPKEKGGVMYVDEKSEYIRSLVRYSAKTSSPIELVTSDGASFECYIDSDLESDDKIVSSEIETEYMNALFENDEDNRKNAEQKVIEFVNGMKHQVDDKEDEVQ